MKELIYKALASDEVQKWLLNALLFILGWCGKKFIEWQNSKIKNETVRNATESIYKKCYAYILDVYKSGAEDLKQKMKDGNFTDEEKAEWKSNLLSYMKLSGKAELNDMQLFGKDAENIIKAHAEEAFLQIKAKFFR